MCLGTSPLKGYAIIGEMGVVVVDELSANELKKILNLLDEELKDSEDE